jgi:hypothetical protein
MKRALRISPILAVALFCSASCQNSGGPTQPEAALAVVQQLETGRLVVRVYFGDEGVPGKTVEVLELHRVGTTDQWGYVTFVLPVGDYTVRVNEVNLGGPAIWDIDRKVTITVGEETSFGVFDCILCV